MSTPRSFWAPHLLMVLLNYADEYCKAGNVCLSSVTVIKSSDTGLKY